MVNHPKPLEKVYIPPMAGVTDLVFRRLVREVLGDLASKVRLSTEMISSKGMMYQDAPTRLRLASDEIGCVVVQLFGHEPDVIARAALRAQEAGAAAIDINMGCPVPKITKGKDGAALMREPDLARDIVRQTLKAVSLPVSVKMRLGWCDSSRNALDLAIMLQDEGVSSLTIHGRTRAQGYSGRADWTAIAQVREKLNIPVYANGDVSSVEAAEQILKVTGAAGVAIARACIGNPWLIINVLRFLHGTSSVAPTPSERLSVARRHLDLAYQDAGESGIQPLKRHMSKYVHDFRGAATLREKLATARNYAQMREALEQISECVAI